MQAKIDDKNYGFKEGNVIDESKIEQIVVEAPDRAGFVAWVKEHRVHLWIAGISITTLLAIIVGLKNKDAINDMWNMLKKEIKEGSTYSSKWFKRASLGELYEARELVEQDYGNPELDIDYRSSCLSMLKKLDNAIGDRRWQGKEYGFPVHSDNGWHLGSSD